MIVVPRTSSLVGQVTLSNSPRTSPKKVRAVPSRSSALKVRTSGGNSTGEHRDGRPGGARTPNPRFWRPVLYRLSYWPSHPSHQQAAINPRRNPWDASESHLTGNLTANQTGLSLRTPDQPSPSAAWAKSTRLPVQYVGPAETAIFAQLHPAGMSCPVLRRRIRTPLAVRAGERDDLTLLFASHSFPVGSAPLESPMDGPSADDSRRPRKDRFRLARSTPGLRWSSRRRPSGHLHGSRSGGRGPWRSG